MVCRRRILAARSKELKRLEGLLEIMGLEMTIKIVKVGAN